MSSPRDSYTLSLNTLSLINFSFAHFPWLRQAEEREWKRWNGILAFSPGDSISSPLRRKQQRALAARLGE